jgi:DNA ligase 1
VAVDLAEGESIEVQGSGAKPYLVKNDGGIYSCTCPAWRHQSRGIDVRTCKHLKRIRGEEAELLRVGADSMPPAPRASSSSGGAAAESKAPPVLLAERWDPGAHDPTGWWASEKLDGVRAYWDGRQFLSRLGNRFVAPDWFVEGLPDHPLDGELWGGRKRFQETVSVVRSVAAGERWKGLAFVVFDAPAHEGTFEARIGAVEALLGGGGSASRYARALEHAQLEGVDHLRQELSRVEALGGEGVMLRQPGSRYIAGRSSTLLKVKSFFDAEAIVIDHVAGAGRHKGRLGSLLVEAADGTRFNVGTGFSDLERGDPPTVGAVITYRYQELTKAGVPRFPSYVGVRVDADRPSAVVGLAQPRAPRVAPAPAPSGSGPVIVQQQVSQEVVMGAERRFEYVEGSSSKFWAVSRDGAVFTTRWGRIGTDGQTKTKEASTEAKAEAEVDKLIAEKVGKGYVEVGGGEAPAPAAPKPAAPKPAAPKPAAAPRPPPAAAAAGGNGVLEVVREVRPLLAKAANRVRKVPGGVSAGALGLDPADGERVARFLAELDEVVGLLAEVE